MHCINWVGNNFDANEGYGRYNQHMVRALSNLGVSVNPIADETLEMPGWMQRLAGVTFDRLTISCIYIDYLRALPGRHWAYSMYEDTSIPDGWADAINQKVERLLVPCEQNADVFKRKGVKVPIHIVYGGTDPAEFPVLPQVQHDRPYTFVCLGDRGVRKGVETAWCAFVRAFENVSDVRLMIKTRAEGMGIGPLNFKDPRISFWADDLPSMADAYAQADVMLFPSYGEGWGMPPREAAMMGLPVITTRFGGLEVGIDNWALPINKVIMQRSMLPTKDGRWAVPDLDEVVALMRWCYEHQDEARQKGLAAALWLRENQTWTHSARQLTGLLEHYVG